MNYDSAQSSITPSQLAHLREVIREHLVPRVVVRRPDSVNGDTWSWVCELCDVVTTPDPSASTIRERAEKPEHAQHTTFCDVGSVLSVME